MQNQPDRTKGWFNEVLCGAIFLFGVLIVGGTIFAWYPLSEVRESTNWKNQGPVAGWQSLGVGIVLCVASASGLYVSAKKRANNVHSQRIKRG